LCQLLNGTGNFKQQIPTNFLVPYLQSEYGLHDIFLGIPCRFGGYGVESLLVIEPERQ
jgi:malate/lactate dehydrogenase